MTIETNSDRCIVIHQGQTNYFTCWADESYRGACPYLDRTIFCTHPEKENFHIISKSRSDLNKIQLFENTGTYPLPAKADKR